MKQNQKRGRRKVRSGMLLTVITVLLLFGAISYKKVSMNSRNAKMKQQEAELKRELKDLKSEQKDIEEYGEYVKTPKYIEDTAREKLGLVYPNEVIFEPDNQ